MSRPSAYRQIFTPLLERKGNPAVVPLPKRTTGNNVPHSMTKTRRTWKPNVHRYDLPVNVLGGALEWEPVQNAKRVQFPQLRGVKMSARDIKTVVKNGGLEGMLLSRPPSKLTPFGRELRAELFETLRALRSAIVDHKAETEVLRIESPKTK